MFERSSLWVNRLEHFASIGSTNTYLEAVSVNNPAEWPDFSAVVADHQTAGKGRMDRTWLSPAGSSLAISILLRHVTQPSWLSAITGLSLLSAVRSLAPNHDIGLKWPNDLLANEKKLAGILVRATSGGYVVGIGINIRPIAEFADTSASLQQLDIESSPDEFLALFLAAFRARYLRMRIEPDDSAMQFKAEYQSECLTLGRRVRVELPTGEELLGLATSVDNSGRLLIARDSEFGAASETFALAAGDVWHLRNL